MKRSRRYHESIEKRGEKMALPLQGALELLKALPAAKFDETMNLAFHLGIDPKKSDQLIRGSVQLPEGSGKKVRVAVVAKESQWEAAREAGADHVGEADLLEKIQGGWFDFDILLATPDVMGGVGKLGKLLGQKGLMPNPKAGTVTTDLVASVKEFKAGKVSYRTDKTANVHVTCGKRSFSSDQLLRNVLAVYRAISQAKPSGVKGVYLESLTLAPVMGPGVRLDINDLERVSKAEKEGAVS